jgi:hypothetical protein
LQSSLQELALKTARGVEVGNLTTHYLMGCIWIEFVNTITHGVRNNSQAPPTLEHPTVLAVSTQQFTGKQLSKDVAQMSDGL